MTAPRAALAGGNTIMAEAFAAFAGTLFKRTMLARLARIRA